jgi:hypothetical protein
VLSEPRSVKTVNELRFYRLLFVDNQPSLYTLLVLSARARLPILIFPQHSPLRPSLTKFVLGFVLAEFQAPWLMLMLVLVPVVLLPLLSSSGGLLRASAPMSASLLLAAVLPEWCKARAANCID